MEECKKIEVEWIDSESWQRWLARENLKAPELLIKSVGFLFYEDEKCIGLTSSQTVDYKSVIDPLWIPKCAIIKIWREYREVMRMDEGHQHGGQS